MKILFAIKRLHQAAGGAERVLSVVAEGLAERGHSVSILSFDHEGSNPFYPLPANVRRIFVPGGDAARPAGFLQTLRRLGPLRAAVTREDPQVVVAFMHSMFIPMALALTGTGRPLVASEHIVPAHYRNRRVEFALLRLAARMARKITVVSAQVKDLYPPDLRRRMIVVPNPVMRSSISLAQPSSSRVLLSVGRLDPQKDHKILIDAFALLAGRYPDWTLRIVGEGPLRPTLERQISDKGLETRIFLPGATQNIEKEYKAAALFIQPSLYESLGLTTTEAMAAGLPVIGFKDCPGTNVLITEAKTGILVEQRSPEALAHALAPLMEDPMKRNAYGNMARQHPTGPDTQTVVALWEDLLKTCV